MLKQQQGILLLALGSPYYGRMAYNLAISIKAKDSTVHITLVYTDAAIAHLNERNMWVFDNKMPYPETLQPFGVKLKLNELTPYDRTLYIDVDTLWINKQSPAELFDKLKGIPFTGITEGMHDYNEPSKSDHSKHYFFWADLDEIKTKYIVDGKLYQWRSEFIYFEKSETTEDFFNIAQIIYEVNSTGISKGNHEPLSTIKKFADTIPDELAINIATNICSIAPHQYKWQPTYWDRLHGGNMPPIEALQNLYHVISCGSNASYGALKRVYDRVCAASACKIGLQHVFPLISKKEMLINRQLM